MTYLVECGFSFRNGLNVVGKALAWWYTGSKSMFPEMMHSVADTLNQVSCYSPLKNNSFLSLRLHSNKSYFLGFRLYSRTVFTPHYNAPISIIRELCILDSNF